MTKPDLRALLASRNLQLCDLARLMGVDPATATRWAQGRVPAERVLALEAATGIGREEIRPDLYPPADTQAA